MTTAVKFDAVLETGTYRGTSTAFLATVFDAPVETVEQNVRYYTYSRSRLGGQSKISIALGDSRDFLRDVARRRPGETVFVYLDAHWEDDLPLAEELDIIASAWSRAVVMIDDFVVPDDPGYGFDDYGPDKKLDEAAFPPMPNWSLHYPAAPSDQETGQKRGCCVLTSPQLSDVRLPGLRFSHLL